MPQTVGRQAAIDTGGCTLRLSRTTGETPGTASSSKSKCKLVGKRDNFKMNNCNAFPPPRQGCCNSFQWRLAHMPKCSVTLLITRLKYLMFRRLQEACNRNCVRGKGPPSSLHPTALQCQTACTDNFASMRAIPSNGNSTASSQRVLCTSFLSLILIPLFHAVFPRTIRTNSFLHA